MLFSKNYKNENKGNAKTGANNIIGHNIVIKSAYEQPVIIMIQLGAI